MDHEAYERHMIETINRHGKEATQVPVEEKCSDVRTVARGLKRTILALFTTALFAISVIGFIAVATAPGYIAVVMFFASVIALLSSFTLLYAQGIIRVEGRGEGK